MNILRNTYSPFQINCRFSVKFTPLLLKYSSYLSMYEYILGRLYIVAWRLFFDPPFSSVCLPGELTLLPLHGSISTTLYIVVDIEFVVETEHEEDSVA